MEDIEIKEAICEIYESIRTGSFTPAFMEIVERYRKDIEIAEDMKEKQVIK